MSVDPSSTPQSPPAGAGADPLADVLRGLRVEGSCYCRTELTAPWGLDFTHCPGVSFHFMAEGSCWFVVDGQPRQLHQGDLVVLPASHPHQLLSEPDVPAAAVLRLPDGTAGQPVTELRHGGGGNPTLVLCGGTRFTEPHTALVAALPPVLQVSPDASPGREWITSTMTVMGIEAARPRPGSETVIARLCDVLVMHAVRCWLETSPEARSGWLGALRDERIGPVLALIHRYPGRPWTVASLAATAHLSRALFAQRFTDLVGEPPIAYLTRRRMEVAATLLRQGADISRAARMVGYGSAAAFSRAYKNATGAPPSTARP
jgi:AraC-like DNA-binding protein